MYIPCCRLALRLVHASQKLPPFFKIFTCREFIYYIFFPKLSHKHEVLHEVTNCEIVTVSEDTCWLSIIVNT